MGMMAEQQSYQAEQATQAKRDLTHGNDQQPTSVIEQRYFIEVG